jgi:hypothetical protein
MNKLILFLFLFLFLIPTYSYALTFSDLEGKRSSFDGKKIVFSGVIKDIKRITKKKSVQVKIKLIDLFSKNKMDVLFIESIDGIKVNDDFTCPNFKTVKLEGIYTSSRSKSLLGSILVNNKNNITCSEAIDIESISKEYTNESLKESKEKLGNKVIKLKGFIKGFKRSHSSKKVEAKFKLIDSKKSKFSTKVILGLQYNDNIINSINCSEGNFVVISGVFKPNKSKNSKELGVLKSLSKNYVECKNSKLELTDKEIFKSKKQIVRERHSKLKILFSKYKKELKTKNINYDLIKTSVDSMTKMCESGGTQSLIKTCIKINSYLKTIDQRNKISFKIQNTLANLIDISILDTYKPKKENNIIEIIKLFYPEKSSYVIGVPARCYDRELYNPSNPSYPYSSLSISKETKQYFTPILAMFNNPKLKCGSLIESIYIIGNMDEDDKLDVLKLFHQTSRSCSIFIASLDIFDMSLEKQASMFFLLHFLSFIRVSRLFTLEPIIISSLEPSTFSPSKTHSRDIPILHSFNILVSLMVPFL